MAARGVMALGMSDAPTLEPAAVAEASPPPPAPKGESLAASSKLWAVLLVVLLVVLLAFVGGWLTARFARSTAPDGVPPETAVREAAAANRAVQALEERVARLEADQALVARVSAAGLAVVNLTAAAENPAGFGPALAAAERTLPASPDLVALRGLASSGAPTRAGLAEAFPGMAARARAAIRADGGGEALGGVRSVLDRFFGRPAPEPRGLSPESVLARAEARVAAGDLEGAAAVLGNLPASAKPVTEPWIAGVRRRLEIDKRLAAVRLMALGQFAATAPPPVTPPPPP